MPVSLEDIQNLSHEVSSLVAAGLPLESHLASAGSGHNKQLQQLTESISNSLQNGESLDAIVRNNALGAPRMLAAAVAAGVQTGKLNETVELLGDMASDLVELRRRILQSLSYPITIVATALVLFMVFIRTFLGSVLRLINDHEIHAPALLRWLLEFDSTYWWWPLMFPMVGVAFVIFWFVSGRAASMAFRGPERLLFLLPGVRTMIRDLQFYSLVRILTLMVERQLPLADSLILAGACSGNIRLDTACQQMSQQIRIGELPGLQPTEDWKPGKLPPLLQVCIQQTSLHESQFCERLQGVTGYYRRRLDSNIAWLRNVVPIVVFVVLGGGTVTLYAAAVFWPVTQIYQYISPQ